VSDARDEDDRDGDYRDRYDRPRRRERYDDPPPRGRSVWPVLLAVGCGVAVLCAGGAGALVYWG
jgi:hypothetical protein